MSARWIGDKSSNDTSLLFRIKINCNSPTGLRTSDTRIGVDEPVVIELLVIGVVVGMMVSSTG